MALGKQLPAETIRYVKVMIPALTDLDILYTVGKLLSY
jgi:hypothetical protein